MSKFDDQYIDLCERILEHGERVLNYSGTDEKRSDRSTAAIPDHVSQRNSEARTLRLPHQILQFDLSDEFPILTSKKVAFKTAVLEILWIYQAASNEIGWLHERGVKIWDEWEIPENSVYQGRNFTEVFQKDHPGEAAPSFPGTIGTAYGWIVRRYDLISNLIDTLRHSPGNRRMVLSLWQNEWLSTAALPSCVWNSQWNLIDGKLNLLVTSRSSDVPLGLPFNVVQYATLCYLIAQVVGAKPGQFTFMTNDAHIYENQVEGIREQIKRYHEAVENGSLPAAPKLWLNPDIHEFSDFDNSRALSDIKLEGYENLGTIKMAVTE